MEREWAAVRHSERIAGESGLVTVEVRELSATSAPSVTATIEVSAAATEPVWFSDGLYGATAWAFDGGNWRRVDTAEMRTMLAPSLDPGAGTSVTLPLDGAHRQVRVLVRTPVDGNGAWADAT